MKILFAVFFAFGLVFQGGMGLGAAAAYGGPSGAAGPAEPLSARRPKRLGRHAAESARPLSALGGDLSLSPGGQAFLAGRPLLLASSEDLDTFNPFVDYGEFQENVAEQESIDFFQRGRALTISALAGYEAITFNMRQIYGDAPFVLGAAAGFFFDLNFAMQISGFFPHKHYLSLTGASPDFSYYGMDFKYYFNKQKLVKGADFLSPYIIFGPFYFRSAGSLGDAFKKKEFAPVIKGATGGAPPAVPEPAELTNEERETEKPFSAFGAKLGLGLEIPLIKKSYIGIEIAYLYTDLLFENSAELHKIKDPKLSHPHNRTIFNRLLQPDRPEVKGRLFHGDIVTALFLIGVSF